MIEILNELIGIAPRGFEFMYHMFAFILVMCGLYVIYSSVRALIDLYK